MLEATNHSLTPSEIAHILVKSSFFPPLVEGERNGAGLFYNDKIGFGMIDAGNAVVLALQYPGHRYAEVFLFFFFSFSFLLFLFGFQKVLFLIVFSK